MAKIPLRAYTKEIDGLIDRGQYEQALAHCRYILKILPKHIDTYRLMAKAYLESQRYGDASDVFQRVLSSIPDDFVSQLGMSIIREDEGNLDAAIWHMERAFELQPSNGAIQSELRRLYGRRDGYEPPKIRLTRGALARMYYKGELYHQAVNELRAALGEDPQRLDLHLLLAKAYQGTGQKVEAVNACTAVLKKLPYCIEANRVQAEILEGMGREEDAKVYRQTAIALNPYLGQISPKAPTPELVPDGAVVVEKLDWVPDRSVASQPRWASTIGVDIGSEQGDQGDAPEWLMELENNVPEGQSGTSAGEPKVSPFVSEQEQTSSGQLIPDWMKDAGWEPSMGDTTQAEMGYTIGEESSDEEGGELAPAEIPSWLKGIAPEEAFPSDQLTDLEDEEVDQELIDALDSAALPWLDESPPGPSDTITGWLDGVDSTEQMEDEDISSEGLPDWIVGATAAGIGLAAGAAARKDRQQEPEDEIASVKEPESEESVSVIAEFDQDFTQDIDGSSDLEAPDWLSDLETADMQDTEPGETAEAEKADLPEWLVGAAAAHAAGELLGTDERDVEEELTEGEPAPGLQDLESMAMEETDELPDWMVAPAAEDESAGELSGELPDWLAETELSEELMKALDLTDAEELAEPVTPAEVSEASVEESIAEALEAEPPETEAPAWLAGAAAGAALGAAALAGSDDEAEEQADLQPAEITVEQAGMTGEQPEPVADIELPEQELEEPSAELEETVSPEEEEAAFAWLEGLAAKQGASEALFTNPDERSDEPPDWVKMEAVLAAGALAWDDGEEGQDELAEQSLDLEGITAEEPAQFEAITDDEAPSPGVYEKDEAEEAFSEMLPEEPSPEAVEAAAAELTKGDEPFDAVSMEDLPEDTSPEEFLPDWLRAAGPESEVDQARAELDEEAEIHAWLSQVDQPGEMVSEITATPEDTGTGDVEALDWLPELPDQIDLDEVLAEMGEDQVLSDWLSRMPADAAVAQAAVEDEQAGQPEKVQSEELEIPGWMAGAAAATITMGQKGEEDQAALFSETEPEDALPEWLEEPEPGDEETPVAVSAEFQEAAEPEISPEDTQPTAVAVAEGDEPPSAEGAVYEFEETPAAESELADEAAAEVQDELSDEDAAFAWLESLAVKQGASEALLLDPDERLEEPPEWVLEESLHAEGAVDQVEIVDEQPLPEAELEETAEKVELQEETSPASEAEEELPEWLIGAGTAASAALAAMLVSDQEEPEEVAASEVETETPSIEMPELEAEIDELIPAEELPELPDWLADLEPETGEEEGEWLPEMADVSSISKAIAGEMEITPLDINSASLIEIERLPGVGFRRAQAVIEYREEHGPIESINALESVEGFDPEMLEELAPYLQVALPDSAEEEISTEMEVDQLIEARAAIYKDDLSTALENYQSLIQNRQSLPEVVKDLEEALYNHPVDASLWMTLGDAQMRAGQLHKALESYNKAEQLLV